MATEETTTAKKPVTRRTTKKAPAKAKPAPELTEVKDEKGRYLTVQQLKNKLRNEAEREVLDTHKDEVVTITQAKYDEHGLKYVRRLTDKEKAAKLIADNLNEFPELREMFAAAGLAHLARLQGQDLAPDADVTLSVTDLEPDEQIRDEDYIAERQRQLDELHASEGVEFREGE
jgi:hypothetical protein